MTMLRKKPDEIPAIQFDGFNAAEIAAQFGITHPLIIEQVDTGIRTLDVNGTTAHIGDWVLRSPDDKLCRAMVLSDEQIRRYYEVVE